MADSPGARWRATTATACTTVRAVPGWLSAISVFLCKSVFCGVFVWARRALNSQKWRFPARAVLQHGLDPSRPDEDGATPLHAAARADGRAALAVPARVLSGSHFRKAAAEYDREPGIKRLSCTGKWQSGVTPLGAAPRAARRQRPGPGAPHAAARRRRRRVRLGARPQCRFGDSEIGAPDLVVNLVCSR
jgi:hypothetical protein